MQFTMKWRDINALARQQWESELDSLAQFLLALKYFFQTNTKKGLFLGQDLSTKF